MKKKNLIFTNLAAAMLAMAACSKEETVTVEPRTIDNEKELTYLMLEASVNPDIVSAMNSEARASLEVGLEESVYFDEILSDESLQTKAFVGEGRELLRSYLLEKSVARKSSTDETFNLGNVEIYWPYCDDWDGVSQPVVVFNHNDEFQYIEDDKTYAYRLSEDGGAVETLIVDEAYAMENPVWVINQSDVTLDDIVNLKNGNYDKTNIVPRNNAETKAVYRDSPLIVNSICSTKQHDDWANGGSEYIILWFYPNETLDHIRENRSWQIQISRKDIKKGKTVDVNLAGNLDWAPMQVYNKLHVMEFDPGKDTEAMVDLKVIIGLNTYTRHSTYKTNKTNDDIMDVEIERGSYLSGENSQLISGYTNKYLQTFSGDGVTVTTTLTVGELPK